MKSNISQDIIDEYRATEFRVGEGPDGFTLRTDLRSDALADLLANAGKTCAIFITAFNPFSQPRSAEQNCMANNFLLAELQHATDHVFVGIGINPSGTWPGEPGYLALGLDLETSRDLGEKFRQNAIIWVGEDAIPDLILLR
jgi:hypothetical protein